MGLRARAFAERLAGRFSISLHYRVCGRAAAFARYLAGLHRARPRAIYVLDVGPAAVAAALAVRRATGCPMILETGDAVAELLRSTGRVGRIGCRAVWLYERGVLKSADAVVVRGTFLRPYLEARGVRVAAVLPDAVDTKVFHPFEPAETRRALGLDGCLTVGVLGSLHWSPRLQWTTGLDLVEALAVLGDGQVQGLVLGGGSGLPRLRARARAVGVEARARFIGWTPHERLPEYINCMDVCLSTQTNDAVGWARTTGKLPLFLACGRFVLASRVGEAARVLPEEMLVEYAAGFDPSYPKRLAARIRRLVDDPSLLRAGECNRDIAEREFDYSVLTPRLASVLESALEQRST